MKNGYKRVISIVLCIAMLAGYVLVGSVTTDNLPTAQAANHGVYGTLVTLKDYGSCPSMQGLALCGDYFYAIKTDGNDYAAAVARVSKSSGSYSWLTNTDNSTKYFYDFGHGNDMDVVVAGGVTTMIVATSTKGSNSLVRYSISGTNATKVAGYTMVNTSGSNIGGGAIRIVRVDSENMYLLFKSGDTLYTATLPISQTSGTITMTKLCTVVYDTVYINGTALDTSGWSGQGMGYYDHKLYLPISGHTTSNVNMSLIAVYDLQGASGNILPQTDPTFCVTSSSYSALFEMESCVIDPATGRLYFNTNRRVSSSDTNHDGIHYISNWTYDPSARTTGVDNYRWEMQGDKLVSVTTGGNAFNGVAMIEGDITDGAISNGRFVLDKTVVLKHGSPWYLEWKGTGSGTSLMFATQAVSNYTDAPYIFCRGNNALISIGAHDGSQYNNYGVALADHGIDGSKEHVYRLTNKIASDGSNMVYLSVDGVELGAMNNHYIGGTSQNTTSDWLNGKDLKFSYLGTNNHKLSNSGLEYIQVCYYGTQSQVDEPGIFRFESQNNALTGISATGLNNNSATMVSGSCSGNVYTDARFSLGRKITLMHDRPWTLEWKTNGAWTGGALLLAADHMSNTPNAPYVFRNSSLLCLGYHNGSKHIQYGVRPADHGVDIDGDHTWSLKNRVEADGSNMVYLYVDGEELAPMNTPCVNGSVSSTTTTSDWVSGKDFVFSYLGTYQHDISAELDYIQVWENGIPGERDAASYRWETQNDAMVSVTGGEFTENPATSIFGTCSGGVYTSSQHILKDTVTLAHDAPWSIEWQAEGNWYGGGLFLCSSLSSYETGNLYLFRNSNMLAFGSYNGSKHEQWGISVADMGVDINLRHVYRIENHIADDGSNMPCLYVDGVEIGTMNHYFVNGSTSSSTTSDWLSGQDLIFSYMGTKEHMVNDTQIAYLQINESCQHTYGEWIGTDAGCTEEGIKTVTCVDCGHVETQTIPATGHAYDMVEHAPACGGYTVYEFTCSACGDNYKLSADEMANSWLEAVPAGMDESLFEARTQYRYSDYETQTSYDTSMEGFTLKSSAWEQSGTGTVQYVNSWPSGFSTSSSLYTQYNKKSSKVTASETETAKTVVNSDAVAGYLYYHWCYADSYYSVESKEGSYTTFHAYYSTTAPSSYNCDTGDYSYQTAHSTCSNSEWFFVAEVYAQKYTNYNKLFTYERWTDYSAWSDTEVTASDTRQVQTRTVYRLKEATPLSHSYTAVVTPPTCTQTGCTTYTCGICGDIYTDTPVAATGHSWTDGTCTACGTVCSHSYLEGSCTVCGAAEPVSQPASIQAKYPALVFEDEILLNLYFTVSDGDGVLLGDVDPSAVGILTWSSPRTDGTVDNAEVVSPGGLYSSDTGYYCVTTKGIAAKNLGDTVYFKIYVQLSDGSYLYTNLLNYSPKTYAMNILNGSYSADMKALVAAMLNYGAAAQTYFNYKPYTLVNSDMTDEHKALVSAYSSTMLDGVVPADASKKGAFASNTGYSERLPSVSFEGAFSINYYLTPKYEVAGEMTFYIWSADTYASVSVLTADNADRVVTMTVDDNGQYSAAVEGIAAKDLDRTVYVAAAYTGTDGVSYNSGIMAYSIGSYCVSQAAASSTIQPFAQATAVYGYYAKLRFYN